MENYIGEEIQTTPDILGTLKIMNITNKDDFVIAESEEERNRYNLQCRAKHHMFTMHRNQLSYTNRSKSKIYCHECAKEAYMEALNAELATKGSTFRVIDCADLKEFKGTLKEQGSVTLKCTHCGDELDYTFNSLNYLYNKKCCCRVDESIIPTVGNLDDFDIIGMKGKNLICRCKKCGDISEKYPYTQKGVDGIQKAKDKLVCRFCSHQEKLKEYQQLAKELNEKSGYNLEVLDYISDGDVQLIIKFKDNLYLQPLSSFKRGCKPCKRYKQK